MFSSTTKLSAMANDQKFKFFKGISKIVNATLFLLVKEIVLHEILDLRFLIKIFSNCLSFRENLFGN